jgi:hypothetical protein
MCRGPMASVVTLGYRDSTSPIESTRSTNSMSQKGYLQ